MKVLLGLVDLAPRVVAAFAGASALIFGVYASWLSLTVLGDGWGVSNWLTAAGVLVVLTPLAILVAAFVNYAVVGFVLSPVRWLIERGLRGTPGR